MTDMHQDKNIRARTHVYYYRERGSSNPSELWGAKFYATESKLMLTYVSCLGFAGTETSINEFCEGKMTAVDGMMSS